MRAHESLASWMMVALLCGCGNGSSTKLEADAATSQTDTSASTAGSGGAEPMAGQVTTTSNGATAGSDNGSGGATTPSADAGTQTLNDSGVDLADADTASDASTSPPVVITPGPFPVVDDFSQPGPYTSTTMVNVGPSNNYTVYMPDEPPPEGARNPLVAWTSGGSTSHTFYTLLPHLASHGFIVVTSNTIPGIGGEAQLGQEIVAGLDWALAENEKSGSTLYQRIDSGKVASAGYSMGSLATFEIADDPRLTTTVHISGGSMTAGVVDKLHAPAAFICGIPDPACTDLLSATCDIAGANCAMDFDEATTPVFYATFQYGHMGILTSPYMERINAMTTAWLRRHLMGDTTLIELFEGSACTYCNDADWTVEQKQLN